jgi:predicted phosphodiesterase
VFSKSFRVLETGTTAVLKRLSHKAQVFFLKVALARSHNLRITFMSSGKNRIGSFFLILFFIPLLVAAQSGPILMSPYLQAATENSIYVLVESATPDPVTVEFGPSVAYGSRASTESLEKTTENTYVHNIRLDGLSPNTQYHYRVLLSSLASPGGTFRTAPKPGTPFRFVWMADFRTNVAIHDSIAVRVAEANPVMSLYGGDLCASSSYSSFKQQFFRPHELALISRVPFFNTPGNHEGWKENTRAFTQAPSSASGTQDYYSFDYGDVHVLVVNNEVPYKEGSPQFVFAQDDLSKSTKPWKIVAAHSPAYCAGGHNEDDEMKTMTQKIFEPNKVDLVMAGHSHFFQHNLVNGIHHFILGSVGAPLYNPSTAPYTLKSLKAYNYGIFDVTPTALVLNVYNERNELLDSLTLSKPGPKRPARRD